MVDQLAFDTDMVMTCNKLAEMLYQEFCAALLQSEKGYDISILNLEERIPPKGASYYAISILGQTLFKISGKQVVNIAVNPKLNNLFQAYGITFKSSKAKNDSNTWKRLEQDAFNCFRWLPPLAVAAFEIFLKENGFDCCSRYESCSDAGHCIHPDIMFAKQCTYRQQLMDGRIFYGKNRNV